MKRSYLSGAQKQAVASEKKRKDDIIVKKTPKLTTFFTRVASTSAQSDSELILEDSTEQPQSISRSSSLEADADLDSPHHVEIDKSEAAGPLSEIHTSLLVQNDIGEWPAVLTDDIRQYWIQVVLALANIKMVILKNQKFLMDLNIAFVLLQCFQEYTYELAKGLKEIGYATLN